MFLRTRRIVLKKEIACAEERHQELENEIKDLDECDSKRDPKKSRLKRELVIEMEESEKLLIRLREQLEKLRATKPLMWFPIFLLMNSVIVLLYWAMALFPVVFDQAAKKLYGTY